MTPSTALATQGSKCSKVGATKVTKSVRYTCRKVGKKKVWTATVATKGKSAKGKGAGASGDDAALTDLKIGQTVGFMKAPPPDASPSQSGPWATRAVVRSSTDGVTFTGREVLMDQAGVPNLLATSRGDLFAYFQDWANGNVISVAIRKAGSASWSRYKVRVNGINLSPGGANGVDPSAIELSDGRIRLFWMQRLNGVRIYSATSSVGEANGIEFAYDGGFAFQSAVGLYDPTVVATANGWSMWISADNAPGIVYATSSDGLRFVEQPLNSALPIANAFPWSATRVSSTETRLLSSINGPGGADGVLFQSTNGGLSFVEIARGILPPGAGGDAAITYDPTTGVWYQLYLERM
jgi:hypothetical protein